MLTTIPSDWQPSDVVYQQLRLLAVPLEFVDDQLLEFRIYWGERGDKQHSWGSKFVKHCIREWRRHQAMAASGQTLQSMNQNWNPSPAAYNALANDGIPTVFARAALPEFIIYWIDRGEVLQTWNAKFIQHVKILWQRNVQTTLSTRSRSLQEDLTDSSWASIASGEDHDS